ncbi:hypothetical protein LPJ66_001229 [Kickxella alabastrina]|uniref:Uncharacterized protein n=1 Tax=Kickxella alabastrina TaxID=61397 RepID=A0ACC1ITV9_9FUNG|nr:hypothetical protein LPJ66_001229 [Kickxella alabastrina]
MPSVPIVRSLAALASRRTVAAGGVYSARQKQPMLWPATAIATSAIQSRNYAATRRPSPTPTRPTTKLAPVATPAFTALVRSDPTLPGQTLTFVQKIKGFVSFYKSGLKELLGNSRAAKGIRQRMLNGQPITREELQIERRNPGDKLRMVPFGFLVLVIPELIPLTIWLFPGVCPSTCVTFSHLAKMGRKQDAARQEAHVWAVNRIRAAGLDAADFAHESALRQLAAREDLAAIFGLSRISAAELRPLCAFMGVAKRRATADALRGRLQKHVEYLCEDDRLLVGEQLVDRLGLAELHRACQERGIPSANYSESHLRRALHDWTRLTRGMAGSGEDLAQNILPIVWSRLVIFQNPVKLLN